ncbi:MAG: protein TolR [Deltaproteobacteria bacterium]|nr:protein TolR [Deltaproteobacteria bacterium]
METGKTTGRRHLSQINVTPLVDVMLVLLIIFMVTAPMMQEGIDVNLPKVEASGMDTQDEPLVITISKDRRVFINDKPFNAAQLKTKLAAIHGNRKDKMILLKADESVPYGYIMSAMSDIRKAGFEKVGMVTEPAGGEK